MIPLRKIALYATAIIAPLALAMAIWLGFAVSEAYHDARFIQGFEQIVHAKSSLTVAQVENLMGKPASIEESQSNDQTISGMVYHYPGHGADFRIVFVNGVVFHAEMPLTKSS